MSVAEFRSLFPGNTGAGLDDVVGRGKKSQWNMNEKSAKTEVERHRAPVVSIRISTMYLESRRAWERQE